MIERERRFLVASLPEPLPEASRIAQAYISTGPASVRVPPRRTGTRPLGLVLVSGEAGLVTAGVPSAADSDCARVTFPTAADFASLVRYVEATGATEVALINAPGEDLARALGARGIDVYTLGPPRQIDLFAA